MEIMIFLCLRGFVIYKVTQKRLITDHIVALDLK